MTCSLVTVTPPHQTSLSLIIYSQGYFLLFVSGIWGPSASSAMTVSGLELATFWSHYILHDILLQRGPSVTFVKIRNRYAIFRSRQILT